MAFDLTKFFNPVVRQLMTLPDAERRQYTMCLNQENHSLYVRLRDETRRAFDAVPVLPRS